MGSRDFNFDISASPFLRALLLCLLCWLLQRARTSRWSIAVAINGKSAINAANGSSQRPVRPAWGVELLFGLGGQEGPGGLSWVCSADLDFLFELICAIRAQAP